MGERRTIKLSDGNVANGHFYITEIRDLIPDHCVGGPSRADMSECLVRIEFVGLDEPVETDIPTEQSGQERKFFRERSAVREFFKRNRLAGGDAIMVEKIGDRRLRVSPLIRADGFPDESLSSAR